MNIKRLFPIFLLFAFASNSVTSAQDGSSNWPNWRGPNFNGVAEPTDPPEEFGESKNLKWKAAIPGLGNSTPIIWEDQLIVLTAVPTDKEPGKEEEALQEGRRMGPPSNGTDQIHQFTVISYNKNNGEINWQTVVKEELPIERTHELGTWASNSPVTDGKHIYAYFGSRGLFCLDFEGNVLWERDWGQMEKKMSFGEGSSPALYKNRIAVLWDHEGDSFITVLDTKTGKDVWKKDREEATSWSTPLILEVNGRVQVITSATSRTRSYDLETGEIIWEGTGMTGNVIPHPVYENGILYLMSGYRGNALQAIDLLRAKGNITGTDAILWEYNQDTPYTPSPVLKDGYLYFLRVNNGFLTCLDAKTGEVKYSKEKVEGISSLFSSPTWADGKLYIAGKESVAVVKAGPEFEQISENKLDDTFHASPVIIGNDLFLRGQKSLYCFSKKQ